MNKTDRATVQKALDHLPAACDYHGERLERVTGFAGSINPCCDTGAPALARRNAETVLGTEATYHAEQA